jgi:hypothetical protein
VRSFNFIFQNNLVNAGNFGAVAAAAINQSNGNGQSSTTTNYYAASSQKSIESRPSKAVFSTLNFFQKKRSVKSKQLLVENKKLYTNESTSGN